MVHTAVLGALRLTIWREAGAFPPRRHRRRSAPAARCRRRWPTACGASTCRARPPPPRREVGTRMTATMAAQRGIAPVTPPTTSMIASTTQSAKMKNSAAMASPTDASPARHRRGGADEHEDVGHAGDGQQHDERDGPRSQSLARHCHGGMPRSFTASLAPPWTGKRTRPCIPGPALQESGMVASDSFAEFLREQLAPMGSRHPAPDVREDRRVLWRGDVRHGDGEHALLCASTSTIARRSGKRSPRRRSTTRRRAPR